MKRGNYDTVPNDSQGDLEQGGTEDVITLKVTRIQVVWFRHKGGTSIYTCVLIQD